MGYFNYSDNCWRNFTTKHNTSRRFLESMDDKCLAQVVGTPTNGAQLNLILTSREGLVAGVKAGGSLGCSDNEIVK